MVDDRDDLSEDAVGTVLIKTRPQPLLHSISGDPSQIRLEVIGGPMDGILSIVNTDTLTVGRGDQNNLVLPLDPGVSGEHACIVREGDKFWLEDKGSRNGTFVGRKRLGGRAHIRPGTVFYVGGTCLEFMPR